MRPRMYGATDMNVLRTTTSPSAGSATSTSTSRKSSGTGRPTGRRASWISRAVWAIARRYPARAMAFRVTRVSELEDIAAAGIHLRPLRRPLGITAFGANAFSAGAGERLIEEHTEAGSGGS